MLVASQLQGFSKIQLWMINLVWLKLQVIFISNLLEPKINRVKECFWQGKRDKFLVSSYKWPDAKPDSIVITT